ncbi:MAG: efflux RND transporter periplasmic adaptor subunit [Anaerovorax sp.]|nr:efflux RND transporter periplasmic adaptor subunit [Anaerovorax sp.]
MLEKINKIKNIKNSKKTMVILLAIIALAALFNVTTGEALIGKEDDSLVVQSSLELKETNVNSLAAGQLKALHIKKGDRVTKGQIIAEIDSNTLLTKKAQAEGNVKAVEGQLLAAQATYQKVLKGATDEELAQAKASYGLAEANFNRISALYSNGAVSKSDYDSVATQYEIIGQKYQAAKKGAQNEDKEAAAAAVDTLEGQLEAAKSALAEVETYLQKTEIIAPCDGVITALNVEQGELVSTGLPVATITSEADPYITCQVSEQQLSHVKQNQQVTVTFPAYKDEVFHGTVTEINKSADFAVKRATNANGSYDVIAFSVTVEPNDVTEELYSGMTVFVDFSGKGK